MWHHACLARLLSRFALEQLVEHLIHLHRIGRVKPPRNRRLPIRLTSLRFRHGRVNDSGCCALKGEAEDLRKSGLIDLTLLRGFGED
jgi:hypothetical protein